MTSGRHSGRQSGRHSGQQSDRLSGRHSGRQQTRNEGGRALLGSEVTAGAVGERTSCARTEGGRWAGEQYRGEAPTYVQAVTHDSRLLARGRMTG